MQQHRLDDGVGLVIDGDDLGVSELVAGQADLFDVGQVRPLLKGLSPTIRLVEIEARAVVTQVARAQYAAFQATTFWGCLSPVYSPNGNGYRCCWRRRQLNA